VTLALLDVFNFVVAYASVAILFSALRIFTLWSPTSFQRFTIGHGQVFGLPKQQESKDPEILLVYYSTG